MVVDVVFVILKVESFVLFELVLVFILLKVYGEFKLWESIVGCIGFMFDVMVLFEVVVVYSLNLFFNS